MDYLHNNNKCFITKCEKEKIDAINKNNTISKQINKAIKDITNKKISQTEFNNKLLLLKKQIFINNKKIKLLNCQLDKCYNIMKKNILKDLNNNLKNPYFNDTKKNIIKKYINIFNNKITLKDYLNYTNDIL